MTTRPIAAITGGAGFIGSHMVDPLLERGYAVRVIDNLVGGGDQSGPSRRRPEPVIRADRHTGARTGPFPVQGCPVCFPFRWHRRHRAIPEEYGGSGLGLSEASVIMEEINRSGGNSGAGCDPNLRDHCVEDLRNEAIALRGMGYRNFT
jgi:hypothetical protein